MESISIQSVKTDNHILGVYTNQETQLRVALDFLKDGIKRNEMGMLITDEIPKSEIRKKIRSSWQVELDKLEANNSVVIKTTPQWYFPFASFNIDRLMTKWSDLMNRYHEIGASGLRVFADMTPFFRYGFSRELLIYESKLERKLGPSVTLVCSYRYENVDRLTARQFRRLQEYHRQVWL